MMLKIRGFLLRVLLPILQRIGRYHLPYTKKKVKAKHYRDFKSVLKPGMVMLTKTEGEMSNLFIPGEVKHGAMYVGSNEVVEALGSGVVITDLLDFLLSKDVVVIVSPLFCGEAEMVEAAVYAKTLVGSPYDYEFKSNNKRFYCFEIGYAAYREAMNGESPWSLRPTFGEPTVTGEDYLNAKKKWSVIRDSRQMS